MKAKRKFTLSITLVAALLMALLTAGTVLAAEGDEITVEGTVLVIEADSFTLEELVSLQIYTVYVGANFNFDSIDEGDIITVTGTEGEDLYTIFMSELKIQERIKDQVKECEGEACFCENIDAVHPVATKIALTYGVDYGIILDYLCGENPVGLGQIMLALQTAVLTGGDWTDYLNADMDEFHWGQIWQDFDVKGKPDKGIPPGEIKDQDKGESGEGKDDQGNEECGEGLLCGLYNWIQNQKGGKGK